MSDKAFGQMEEVFINDGLGLSTSVKKNSSKEDFFVVLRNLYHQTELLTDSFIESCSKSGKPVDCKMGCGWCCHQSVFASTHEMLYLVDYLKSRYKPEVVESVAERALSKSQKTKGMTRSELLGNKIACPLLQNNKCMVYSARPMACRIYLSSDVNTCIERYQKPVEEGVRPALFKFILDAGRYMNYGFVSGLKNKGLHSNEAPLEWLLNDLINKENAMEEWLEGAILNEAYEFE
ncbi:YkgJ family cysteine cluster protein [Alkalitalea saponilacus]|nr:YkgJ family cysteine cluster protein [Alkalitalea saponilacus]ASB50004.1 hypothetical protein CDL62_13090 [Alkalitalea saponilacus]